MSDRELLELAAKAAGYKWSAKIAKEREALGVIGLWLLRDDGQLGSTNWNPLEKDGDALRLAVSMSLTVRSSETNATAWCSTEKWFTEPHNSCAFSATRRAIVCAAAEIGRAMP